MARSECSLYKTCCSIPQRFCLDDQLYHHETSNSSSGDGAGSDGVGVVGVGSGGSDGVDAGISDGGCSGGSCTVVMSCNMRTARGQ